MEVEAEEYSDEEERTDDEEEEANLNIERQAIAASDDEDDHDDNDSSENDEENADEEMNEAEDVTMNDDHEGDEVDNEDEDEEVLTAVVIDEDEEDLGTDDEATVAVVEAVAIKEKENPILSNNRKSTRAPKGKKSNPPQFSSKRGERQKSVSKFVDLSPEKSIKTKKAVLANTSIVYSKSVSNRESKKSKTLSLDESTIVTEESLYKNVSSAILQAASDARAMLRETVPLLPFPIAETQIRSLGRLCVQVGSGSIKSSNGDSRFIQSKFCSSKSLYPVGFSCDRYEFSPVHGRVLKMRCSILDGKSIKRKQRELLRAQEKELAVATITNVSDVHDGPVFRVTWGRGVDEDPENDIEHAYDPDLHSPPLIVNRKGKPKMYLSNGDGSMIKPEKGMRVRVRIDKDLYSNGQIIEITYLQSKVGGNSKKSYDKQSDSNNSLQNFSLEVLYDYGVTEIIEYPDPDVELIMPGAEDDIGPGGELELIEMHGKPVFSVVGESPIEAWGKVLCRLGLIDEIILKRALSFLHASRDEGLQEAKDKLDGKQKPRHQFHTTHIEKRESISGRSSPSNDFSVKLIENNGRIDSMKEDKSPSETYQEPTSERENELRSRVQKLLLDLELLKQEDRKAQVVLANAKIRDLGPFLCNPFLDDESGKSQQSSWLATAVRKEKARMGSTGNRRKVVTALDLLERNDTFYTADIESLVEGLPGSELCSPYVFQAYRTASGTFNRSWMHEAQVKNEVESVPGQRKNSLEEQVDDAEQQESERELKKRKRDEVRDSRKMQKLAEEEERKKIRVDERLSRLEIQIKDRLYKEASMQREKVILLMARSVSKEFNRRRKLAELVAGQAISDVRKKDSRLFQTSEYEPLPSIAKIYDEDTVRVWNFISTFQSFLLQRGYVQEIQSLEALQTAIDCIRGDPSGNSISSDEAVSSLTDLAVALCKPLAASLTRVLFASLIALNPALQRDFGAAFFNVVNATSPGIEDSIDNTAHPDVLLPVNSMTWQEVARLAFLADALGEMGYSRQEAAHLLRGYRSAGHPNSKESKRLRKAEDYSISILRQKVSECRETTSTDFFPKDRTRIAAPCSPFLADKVSDRCTPGKWPWSYCDGDLCSSLCSKQKRQRVGLLKWLNLSSTDYKALSLKKEQYMEDALKFREEMDRAKRKDEDEDDEEDDEEEEDTGVIRKGETKQDLEASSAVIAAVELNPSNAHSETNVSALKVDSEEVESKRIGKKTPFDDFCGDVPSAPEVIRRCLAVLRALSMSPSAEPFLYPIDPQTNPGYYDNILKPMCLRECGKQLKDMVSRFTICDAAAQHSRLLEDVVVQFGRNVRLIAQNCLAYANAGPMVIAAGSELLRIFERLFFDWVLAPDPFLPSLDTLDDEKCVEHHASDEQNTVLLCDGCEGKYNIARLSPPLREVPAGDWYCPRCVGERWHGSLDNRIGKTVKKVIEVDGKYEVTEKSCCVKKCIFWYGEDQGADPSLGYELQFEDESIEVWSLEEVDRAMALSNVHVEPIRWQRAVAESPGYGYGVDVGLRTDLVPIPLHPVISEASAQVALSSSVFRDTITASATLLLIDPREMTASEWLRLLVLLVMKCSSSDVIQNVVSKMENDAAEIMAKNLENVGQISGIQEILPPINEDCYNDEAVEDDEAVIAHSLPTVKPELNTEGVDITTNLSDAQVSLQNVIKAGSEEPDMLVSSDTAVLHSNSPFQNESSSVAEPELGQTAVEELDRFTTAFIEKGKRQKSVEDSIVAYCVKNQVQAAVASFEEDLVSPAIDLCLSTKETGLQFSTLRCRQLSCHFCGLSDIALGLPLLRVPNEREWEEMFAHASRSRRTNLIAAIPQQAMTNSWEDVNLVVVSLILGGELVSVPDNSLVDLVDGGMLEFTPRSQAAFQDEILFRSNNSFPFVTGSLSAHECCAIAAHNARKDLMAQKYKEHQIELIEKEAGMRCGRTLEVGRDRYGRSYWKFFSVPQTLFVCIEEGVHPQCDDKIGSWHHFSDPASIASLIISLKKDPIVRDLTRAYPDAYKLVRDGTWSDIILKRKYPNVPRFLSNEEVFVNAEGFLPDEKSLSLDIISKVFKVGDHVMVESVSQKLLWDAKIVAVSKGHVSEGSDNLTIEAYRVEYKGWGSRFASWVDSTRVYRCCGERMKLQDLKFDERAISKCGLPTSLNFLVAKDYLQARDRARGNKPLPDFPLIAEIKDNRYTNLRTFALMKAAILAIEAALPLGAVDNSDSGMWQPDFAEQWRLLVINSEGPAALMRCFFVLEDAIFPEWVKEDVNHLRSCLPDRWKAVGEASPSALAIRGIMLDRSIKYGKVDRKRFANSVKKKKKK